MSEVVEAPTGESDGSIGSKGDIDLQQATDDITTEAAQPPAVDNAGHFSVSVTFLDQQLILYHYSSR